MPRPSFGLLSFGDRKNNNKPGPSTKLTLNLD